MASQENPTDYHEQTRAQRGEHRRRVRRNAIVAATSGTVALAIAFGAGYAVGNRGEKPSAVSASAEPSPATPSETPRQSQPRLSEAEQQVLDAAKQEKEKLVQSLNRYITNYDESLDVVTAEVALGTFTVERPDTKPQTYGPLFVLAVGDELGPSLKGTYVGLPEETPTGEISIQLLHVDDDFAGDNTKVSFTAGGNQTVLHEAPLSFGYDEEGHLDLFAYDPTYQGSFEEGGVYQLGMQASPSSIELI